MKHGQQKVKKNISKIKI